MLRVSESVASGWSLSADRLSALGPTDGFSLAVRAGCQRFRSSLNFASPFSASLKALLLLRSLRCALFPFSVRVQGQFGGDLLVLNVISDSSSFCHRPV